MRKRYKRKKRSCGVCHANKRGWTIRWTPRELLKRREWERQRKDLLG